MADSLVVRESGAADDAKERGVQWYRVQAGVAERSGAVRRARLFSARKADIGEEDFSEKSDDVHCGIIIATTFVIHMSLFGSIKSDRYLGVDIGTTSIKAAELSKSSKGVFTLSNYALMEAYGHLERFNSALQSSSLKLLDSDIVSYLKLMMSKGGFSTNRVIASLPAFSAFTTLLELPLMSDREIGQSIAFQAKNYVPLPISTVTLDWVKVGEKQDANGSKKQQVFLISVANEQIEKYTNIFHAAGLKLEALEIEGISIARALTIGKPKPVLIIDIGGRSTALSIAQNGFLKFAGQTDFSSGSLTQALSTALNISARRAEDLKRQTTLMGGAGEQELSTIMLPIIDAILNEAKRVRSGFETGYRDQVTSVILAGSGANLSGLDAYASKQLGLPVTVANPLEHIAYPPELSPLMKSLGPTLSNVIGLGIKNFQ